MSSKHEIVPENRVHPSYTPIEVVEKADPGVTSIMAHCNFHGDWYFSRPDESTTVFHCSHADHTPVGSSRGYSPIPGSKHDW